MTCLTLGRPLSIAPRYGTFSLTGVNEDMKQVSFLMSKYARSGVLAGRVDGDNARHKLLSQLGAPDLPTIVVLDFSSVQLATASFLDESVLKLREDLSDRPVYLIVSNLLPAVEEELDALLYRAQDAFLAMKCGPDGSFSNAHLLGSLDPKLKDAYERIKEKREASATELHSESRDSENIGPTAWNNRLNVLTSKGLLVEIPTGKSKKYKPLEEILNGA